MGVNTFSWIDSKSAVTGPVLPVPPELPLLALPVVPLEFRPWPLPAHPASAVATIVALTNRAILSLCCKGDMTITQVQ